MSVRDSMDHPRPEAIVQWLRSLPTGTERSALIHILECAECRDRALAELRRPRADHEPADVLPWRPEPSDQRDRRAVDDAPTATFRRLCSRALACAEEEQERSLVLFDELRAQPPARREFLVRNSGRFASLALAQRVLEASHEACFRDAREAESLARLGLAIVESVDVEFYGRRLVCDLLARAWAHVGNALRLRSDLAGAERAFHQGGVHLRDTSDPMEEANFLFLLAALRKYQRRFDEALELLGRAAELFTEVGDDRRLARTLTSLGSQHLDRGCPEEAVEPLTEALERVDAADDPRTALQIHHNLTLCLAETGRFLEAQRLFLEGQPLYRRIEDRLTRLRAHWLEGILAAGTGREARAEELFRDVQTAYTEAEMPLDACLVALERAALYARQRRDGELKVLAEELAPALAGLHLERDALTALTLFLQAARRETVTEELVRRASRHLEDARRPSRPGYPD